MQIKQPEGNRVREGVTDEQLKKLHEDIEKEFPRYSTRKVDPEEAIKKTHRDRK